MAFLLDIYDNRSSCLLYLEYLHAFMDKISSEEPVSYIVFQPANRNAESKEWMMMQEVR